MPSYGNHDVLLHMNKKQKLDVLQKQAYYNVLHAFKAESPIVSSVIKSFLFYALIRFLGSFADVFCSSAKDFDRKRPDERIED